MVTPKPTSANRLYDPPNQEDGRGISKSIHPGGLEITRRGLELCALPAGAWIMDLGCGSGASLNLYGAQYRMGGLDDSLLQLQNGSSGSLGLAAGISQAVPFANDSLDAVMIECLLSMQTDWKATLGECSRILKPGGYLILNDLVAPDATSLDCLKALPPQAGFLGVTTRDKLNQELLERKLIPQVWEDFSPALRTFSNTASRYFGRLSKTDSSVNMDSMDIFIHLARARLGYFLVIARKGSPLAKGQSEM